MPSKASWLGSLYSQWICWNVVCNVTLVRHQQLQYKKWSTSTLGVCTTTGNERKLCVLCCHCVVIIALRSTIIVLFTHKKWKHLFLLLCLFKDMCVCTFTHYYYCQYLRESLELLSMVNGAKALRKSRENWKNFHFTMCIIRCVSVVYYWLVVDIWETDFITII